MKRKRIDEGIYDDDDGDPYVPSDSEGEYSESERILLENVRKGKNAALEESEEEVFGVGGSSDDEEEKKISESDIEGKEDEDDDLPDVKAWGKKKKNFYRTDYVDQDYGGYNEKDMEAAQQEEEEARTIQKRLAEQLDDDDFSLDIFNKKPVEKETEAQEVIKSDLRKMSKRQKLALMQKESPEFFGLVDDFKKSMVELQEKLEPMLKLMKEGKIPASPADDYVHTKYHLLLNYCTNIAFYLLLKAKRITVQSHPVIRRLYQFRQLLKQLESVDQVVEPQIEVILEEQRDAQGDITTKKSKKKKKMLKLLSKLEEDKPEDEDHTDDTELFTKTESNEEDGGEDNAKEIEEGANEEKDDEEGKRAITYQIAKNKGLTPHRKKENRNPRVKHRNKFRKAKIRRKGQVREPKKEVKKYGGEISGIKIGVVKSIKLK